MIDHIPLSPSAATRYVRPHYYGGPLDGAVGTTITDEPLRGSIRQSGGAYSLQGFYTPEGTPDVLLPWTTTMAVYLWEAGE